MRGLGFLFSLLIWICGFFIIIPILITRDCLQYLLYFIETVEDTLCISGGGNSPSIFSKASESPLPKMPNWIYSWSRWNMIKTFGSESSLIPQKRKD